jgi:pSer/pThr/pTyr-binding forkhead associated (FHA) protein
VDEDTGIDELTIAQPLPDLQAALRRQRPHILELVKGPDAPRQFVLSGAELIVGRSKEADIQIESKSLSRQHMLLVRDEDGFTCKDMGSRNGFFLNGLKIHSAVLRDGDTLQLCDVVFLYHEGIT